jgi:hypothetical protein
VYNQLAVQLQPDELAMDVDQLVHLWERWDNRPGDTDTAGSLQTAIEEWAAERGKPWLQTRRSMQALRRQGFSREETLESLEM